MIEIFTTKNKEYFIWKVSDLPTLESFRILPDKDGLNPLPVSLSIEQVSLLVYHLKVAKLVKTVYYIPTIQEVNDYQNIHQQEYLKWQQEKSMYSATLRDIHVFKLNVPKPSKPILPFCVEINSLNYPWVKVVEAEDDDSHQDHQERINVFLSLWKDDWWIGNGGIFGGDYLLYQEHPDDCHSSYIVTLTAGKVSARDLVCLSRLGTSVKKNHVFCTWDYESQMVIYLQSEWSNWI